MHVESEQNTGRKKLLIRYKTRHECMLSFVLYTTTLRFQFQIMLNALATCPPKSVPHNISARSNFVACQRRGTLSSSSNKNGKGVGIGK